jgi:pimeloyl-ACP methyl ester carboxylesterase
VNESVFDVVGPDGLTRRGLLHRARGVSRAAVLLLPSGLKFRAGSHLLNVRFARHLAELGYPCLRLDPLGVGESDGHLSAVKAEHLGSAIESGLFVDDVLLGVSALRERLGVDQVVLLGLCGGAVTGVLAAARAPDLVQGVVSMGLPVVPYAPPATRPLPTARVARRRVGNYVRKLVSTDAWARVLRGESDFRGISRTLRSALTRSPSKPTSPQAAYLDDENPMFIEGFRVLQAAKIPHLMIFGSSDNRWLEFENTFLLRELHGAMSSDHYAIELVPQGSHEFHFEPSKVQATELLARWMSERFHADLSASEASHDAQ